MTYIQHIVPLCAP